MCGQNNNAPDLSRRCLTAADYVNGVVSGDRAALARAITLVESQAPAHQKLAQEVLTSLMPKRCEAVRVGITGVPGAGKSTLIECLGGQLTAAGHRVAVLAVDPSSSLTGGSILGDKTRMEKLAADPQSFIRPSPASGALGGVARKTRESMILLEAAGYDVILVETVGVGQSESQVRSMVDVFLLLLLAGAGDGLQGIKKGVIELADALIINKADGDGAAAAAATRGEFERVMQLVRPATDGWQTRVHACSALVGTGVAELWTIVEQFLETTRASGALADRRARQEIMWVRELVRAGLLARFAAQPGVAAAQADLEAQVVKGTLPAPAAAGRILALYGGIPGLDAEPDND